MPQLRRNSLTKISTCVANGSLPLLVSNTSMTFGTTYTIMPITMPRQMIDSTIGIEHGAQDLLARDFAVLGVVGQALEHAVQVAGAFARGHRRAVDLREHARKFGEAVGQRVAFHDLGAHAEQDALNARLLGLLGDREQRFFERQAGLDQRRELARQQRQIAGGDAAPHG